MKVVYIFRKSDSIRIPFFDYDSRLFYLLVSIGSGIWYKDRKEFIFNRDLKAEHFSQISSYLPYIWVDEDSPEPMYFLNCKNLPENEEITFDESIATNKEPCNFFINNGKSSDKESHDNYSHLAQTVFSMEDQFRSSEIFPEYWRSKLEDELRSRKYSIQTRRSYIYYNKLLCRTLQKKPEEITQEDITQFLAIFEKDKEYSASSINLAISAIKFFYREVLKNSNISERHRPRNDGRLPIVLSQAEICKMFNMEKNPKHRLLLMMVYSSGLRVSEVVNLKKEHIDFSRKVIYVKQGKGRKDRCTILSEKVARFTAEYCDFYNIQKWLFPGQTPGRPLSIRSAQNIFDKAVRHAEITKKPSIHSLRHTFATHLLESGTDIRYIQSLLGHSNLRTTERYTHVARRSILNIKSPLDNISIST